MNDFLESLSLGTTANTQSGDLQGNVGSLKLVVKFLASWLKLLSAAAISYKVRICILNIIIYYMRPHLFKRWNKRGTSPCEKDLFVVKVVL